MRPGSFCPPVWRVVGKPISPTLRSSEHAAAAALSAVAAFRYNIRTVSKKEKTESGGSAMIIREFDIRPCTMRKEDPTWRFALAASPVTEGHVVRIATQDGIEGFGYASATPHMGSTADTLKAELELFRPHLIGRDPRSIEAILVDLDKALRGAPQAKAAIDCALHDLVARALGVPLN